MHAEAYNGFARMLALSGLDPDRPWLALDVGGADVNGTVRVQLPAATWQGLDIEAAPGVDIIADAADPGWLTELDYRFDVVIATELFEHTPVWSEIIANMYQALSPEGPQLLIFTCASDGRPPHGARGEWGVPEGQFYGNVTPSALRERLSEFFHEVHVEYNPNPGDAYGFARGLK